MKLDTLTKAQCEIVRLWRNEALETLRTPYPLTREMQEDFYEDVICNRNSPHRYWAIIRTIDDEIEGLVPETGFIGMGGLSYIQWENRIGEISLILVPAERRKGYGKKAVELLLDQAFNYMNLKTVWGECYWSNGMGVDFWMKIVEKKYKGFGVALPNRKFWKDRYYDSYYFSIDCNDFNGKSSVKN